MRAELALAATVAFWCYRFAGNVMRKAKLVSLFAVLALAVAGAGCNTVKGAGKDVQKAGQAVERAADKAQH